MRLAPPSLAGRAASCLLAVLGIGDELWPLARNILGRPQVGIRSAAPRPLLPPGDAEDCERAVNIFGVVLARMLLHLLPIRRLGIASGDEEDIGQGGDQLMAGGGRGRLRSEGALVD